MLRRELTDVQWERISDLVSIPTALLDDIEAHLPMEDLERQRSSILTRAWVTSRMMQVAQIALGEIAIRRKMQDFDKETGEQIEVEVEETVLNLSAANKALELLGHEVSRVAAGGDAVRAIGAPGRSVDTDKLLEGFTVGPGPKDRKH